MKVRLREQLAAGFAVPLVVLLIVVRASQMRNTTSLVNATIAPIAETAREHSATAERVATSTTKLASQVQEMDATARALAGQAASLTALIGAFRFERKSELAVEDPSSLAV